MDHSRLFQFRNFGNRPYFVAPRNRTTGRGGAGLFGAIQPAGPSPCRGGTIGTLGRLIFDALDNLSILLWTILLPLTERIVHLRMIAQNIFNHPTFQIADQTADSDYFGKDHEPFAGARRVPVRLVTGLLRGGVKEEYWPR